MKQFFSPEQVAKLNSKLDGSKVKTRTQSGQELSYIEGHTAIQTANEVFGFGNWDGYVLKLEAVEDTTFEKNGKTGYRVGYLCQYQVAIRNEHGERCVYSDVGFGSGTSYNSKGDAVESAAKEAVTDAMKRAFRNLGNILGLALYDKDQKNVERLPDIAQVNAAYKLVPEALRETAKKKMADILAANGFTQLKEADGKTLKEVFDFFQSLSKAS